VSEGAGEAEDAAAALLPYLHLARRSGALVLGYRAVKASLKRGDCALLVLAKDAGLSLKRLATGEVPTLELADRRRLGEWLGREELAVLGITDRQLSAGVLKRLDSD
jgi:ribosomal protein L7Ae-like RNA K-turn-binding protein